MQLRRFTEYALRTLAYLARHPNRVVTIAEIAGACRISSNHLMKVVQHLAAEGDIVTMRGQHGGLRLARSAATIPLGTVVRRTEPALDPPRDRARGPDGTDPVKQVLAQAFAQFLGALDAYTVADLALTGEAAGPEPDRPAPNRPASDPTA